MVDDSSVYKEDLARGLAEVEKAGISSDAEDESDCVRFERFVFWTAFVTRKLIEANKLSDELEATRFPMVAYPRIAPDRSIDFLNNHHVDRFYDFGAAIDRQMSLIEICNVLIHSFVFIPARDEDTSNLAGILVNSDWTKDEALFFIEWETFRSLVEQVIVDDLVELDFSRLTGALRKSREQSGDSSWTDPPMAAE